MQIWQLEPHHSPMRVAPAMIAELLAAVTDPDDSRLPHAILNLVRCEMEAINCAVFYLAGNTQPQLIGHAEVAERTHTGRVGCTYAHQYYRHDQGLRHALQLGRNGGAHHTTLLHHRAEDILNRDYRLRCYDEVGTRQRFAVMRRLNTQDSLLVGIYRASPSLSCTDREFLSQTAAWIGEAAAQRLRALPPAATALDSALTACTTQRQIRLSPREKQVLLAMLQGHTVPHMAQALGVAPTSIDTYRQRAWGKLGVTSRQDLWNKVLSHYNALQRGA